MKNFVVANWKMNPQALTEAKQLFHLIKKGLGDIKNIEIIICPPFIYLSQLKSKDPKLSLGAQDCFYEEKGAYTGEISPVMLKNFDCKYVILGHSERRRYFSETDEAINKKIKASLIAKLNPIFCIGETQEEKNKGITRKVLSSQIRKGLKGLEKTKIKKVKIAYEPIWAIGTGKACLPIEAGKAGDFIRKTISRIYNKKIARNLRLLYGGSVNSQNAALYISGIGFQGLLVGGASLNSEEFLEILKNTNEA